MLTEHLELGEFPEGTGDEKGKTEGDQQERPLLPISLPPPQTVTRCSGLECEFTEIAPEYSYCQRPQQASQQINLHHFYVEKM